MLYIANTLKICSKYLSSYSQTYLNPNFLQGSCNAFRTSTISIQHNNLGTVL